MVIMSTCRNSLSGLWFQLFSLFNYCPTNSSRTGRSVVGGIVQFKAELTSSAVHVKDKLFNPVIIYGVCNQRRRFWPCLFLHSFLHSFEFYFQPGWLWSWLLKPFLDAPPPPISTTTSPDTAKIFGWGGGGCHLLPASSSCFHKYDKPLKRLEVINAASNGQKEWQVHSGT